MYRFIDNRARIAVAPKTQILQRIDRLHRDTGITLSRIGREAVGDPALVTDLRAGRTPRASTIARLSAYLSAREANHA
jgi:hypothetical protein